jgi:hypothetical protein
MARQVQCEVALGDPGYLYTSRMLVQAGATLLQERRQLLATVGAPGGVFTVGTLFRNSSLTDRLNSVGVKFSMKKSGRREGSIISS